MLTVGDVLPDIQRVLGGVDRTEGLSRLNDAVEVLATETEWSPLRGFLDILVTPEADGSSNYILTLPREVGTILAVNFGGRPTQGHDFWFRFHLNGPGNGCDYQISGFHWIDDLFVPVYQDPNQTSGDYLVCTLETATDNNKAVRVYGYDVNNQWIRTPNGITGLLEDGFLVPTVYGAPAPAPAAPKIKRIVRVSLAAHTGKITLNILNADNSLTPIGQYFSVDTEPQYRRLRLGMPGATNSNLWVRVAFKKTVETLSLDTDLIPLHSKYAIVMMVKSLMKIDSDRLEEAAKYQAMAVAYLNKKQESIDPPGGPSIQMADNNLIVDKADRIDP